MPAALATILLVEDERTLRRVTERALRASGFRVLPAADGAGALALYASRWREIDLVLADLIIPGPRGRELHDALRDINPAVQVLFMSGHPSIEHARESGGLDPSVPFLQKPWRLPELVARVRAMLDGPVAGGPADPSH